MYHTLFPQLIAGPIVRYAEVEHSIYKRSLVFENIENGVFRFSMGLAKKVILADNLGVLADRVFALSLDQLNSHVAWIGALAYTAQIYLDFSGYSDMAIGMGLMLGFRFPENFNQPYRSLSVTEFWRRWHMTLTRWFRDYVYIPLGGNRQGFVRTTLNLFAVFLLCGLWHGAAYTFALWGLFHGMILVLERPFGLGKPDDRPGPIQSIVRWCGTITLVIIGWVMFRSPSVNGAMQFLKSMAGVRAGANPVEVAINITADKYVSLHSALLR